MLPLCLVVGREIASSDFLIECGLDIGTFRKSVTPSQMTIHRGAVKRYEIAR